MTAQGGSGEPSQRAEGAGCRKEAWSLLHSVPLELCDRGKFLSHSEPPWGNGCHKGCDSVTV